MCVRSGNLLYEFLDTPGLGDTNGSEQDKENLSQVISTVFQLGDLNGCMLLVPNNCARLDSQLSYGLTMLLANVHEEFAKNMFLVLTQAGATKRVGPGLSTVQQYLKSNDITGVTLDETKNVFVVECLPLNELAAIKVGFTRDEEERETAEMGWRRTSRSISAMLEYMQTLPSQDMTAVVSVMRAREAIPALLEPLLKVECSLAMQLEMIQKKREQIERHGADAEALRKLAYTEQVRVDIEDLPNSVLVCSECTTTSIDSRLQYDSRCHELCSLCKEYKAHSKWTCKALDGLLFQDCKGCGHGGRMHTWAGSIARYRTEKIANQDLLREISKFKSREEYTRRGIEELEKNKSAMLQDQQFIQESLIAMNDFLQKNAVQKTNDMLEIYFQKEIGNVEMQEKDEDMRAKKLNVLNARLIVHREEKKRFNAALKKAGTQGQRKLLHTPEDILRCIQELEKLKYTRGVMLDLKDKSRMSDPIFKSVF